MSTRLVLLVALAAVAGPAIVGCANGPTTGIPVPAKYAPSPSASATFTPYSVSTTVPLPSGAVPVSIAIPTPAGGGNVVAGTITFPAPTAPYGANASVKVSVSTTGTAGTSSSARRGAQDTPSYTAGTAASMSFFFPTQTTYATAAQINLTSAVGTAVNFAYPALWQYQYVEDYSVGVLQATSTGPLPVTLNGPLLVEVFPAISTAGGVLSFNVITLAGTYTYDSADKEISASSGIAPQSVSVSGSATFSLYSLSPSQSIISSGSYARQDTYYPALGCDNIATAVFGQSTTDSNGFPFTPVTLTGNAVGTCTMYILDSLFWYTTVSVTVTPAPVPVVPPSSPVTLYENSSTTFTVSQKNNTGGFKVSVPSSCTAVTSASVSGSTITVNSGSSTGTCTLTVTGDGNQSTQVSVTVQPPPYGPVTISGLGTPATLSLPSTTATTSFSVSQTGFGGGTFTTSGCSGIATASNLTASGGAATINLTGVAGGSCTLTITGGGNQSATVAVNVPYTTGIIGNSEVRR